MIAIRSIWAPLAFLMVFLGVSQVMAASGTVTGKLYVYINQGQSCDSSTMNCSAARFLTPTDPWQVIKETKVEVADQNGAIIGVSNTDSNGNFSINWTRSSTPTKAHVRWVYAHKDNRFRVVPPSNNTSVYYSSTWEFNVTNGQTTAIGNAYFGDTEERQVYDSSYRMWDQAIKYSGVGGSVFYDVRLAPNDPDTNTGRASASTSEALIRLGPVSARYPLSDVQHEIGHALHRPTDTSVRAVVAYNYPLACSNGGCKGDDAACAADPVCTEGHSLTSQEWKATGFPEAIGTHLGMVASYWYWAVQPQFCINSLTPCGSSGNNLETSSQSCGTGAGRFELSAITYLWDVYDSVNDSHYNDAVGADNTTAFWYGSMVDALSTYPAGFGNGQANEPWTNNTFTVTDSLDGRSTSDYQGKLGATSSTQRTNNCNP